LDSLCHANARRFQNPLRVDRFWLAGRKRARAGRASLTGELFWRHQSDRALLRRPWKSVVGLLVCELLVVFEGHTRKTCSVWAKSLPPLVEKARFQSLFARRLQKTAFFRHFLRLFSCVPLPRWL